MRIITILTLEVICNSLGYSSEDKAAKTHFLLYAPYLVQRSQPRKSCFLENGETVLMQRLCVVQCLKQAKEAICQRGAILS